jgi:hypothetical protein
MNQALYAHMNNKREKKKKKNNVDHSFSFQPQMKNQDPRIESISYHNGCCGINVSPKVQILET